MKKFKNIFGFIAISCFLLYQINVLKIFIIPAICSSILYFFTLILDFKWILDREKVKLYNNSRYLTNKPKNGYIYCLINYIRNLWNSFL